MSDQHLLPEEYAPLPDNLTKERIAEMLRAGETTLQHVGEALNLTAEEIRFCELYYDEFAGDGLSSTASVFNLNLAVRRQAAQARTIANRLLGNPNILILINAQLSAKALNDTHVDSVLAGLISQKQDLKVAVTGVKLYNEITNRQKRMEEAAAKNVFDYSRLCEDELISLVTLLEKARVDSGEDHPFTVTETLNNEVNLSEEGEVEIID